MKKELTFSKNGLLLFFILAFFARGQDLRKTVSKWRTHSDEFKCPAFYLSMPSVVGGTSYKLDTEKTFEFVGTRIGVNWVSRKERKFKVIASISSASAPESNDVSQYEIGAMIGKLKMGNRRGFWDINVGLSIVGGKQSSNWGIISYPNPDYYEQTLPSTTVGLPFDLGVYTKRSVLGVGVSFVGNINLIQPYIGGCLSLRIGNPVITSNSEE